MLSVTFIIPALNEEHLLPSLLTSIKGLDKNDPITQIECIIVDAGSSDATLAIAASFGCKIVHSTEGNISKSRNLGASVASGDILAFIDADCELPSNWLFEVTKHLKVEDISAVGMAMRLPDNAGWVEKAWFVLAYKNDEQAEMKATDVRWLGAFNFAVKRKVFNSIGGFDENLPTAEDFELGERLNNHGRVLRLETSMGVIHHGESKTLSGFMQREAWRGRGEIPLLKMSNKNWRTILSFLLPIVVVAGILGGLAILTSAIALGTFGWYPMVAAVAIGVIPTLLLVLRRSVAAHLLIPAWLLLNIYFISRTIGIFHPIDRVTR